MIFKKLFFFNNIVTIRNSAFEVGDQVLQINGENISSAQDINQIMGQTDIESVVEFKVKRPKRKET